MTSSRSAATELPLAHGQLSTVHRELHGYRQLASSVVQTLRTELAEDKARFASAARQFQAQHDVRCVAIAAQTASHELQFDDDRAHDDHAMSAEAGPPHWCGAVGVTTVAQGPSAVSRQGGSWWVAPVSASRGREGEPR